MSQTSRDYSEKRDYIRMRLDAPVILHHAGREIPAMCLDLSSTGMQLEADILQERRKLYEWVLEPLYSVTRRQTTPEATP